MWLLRWQLAALKSYLQKIRLSWSLESRVYLSCFSKPRAGSQGCNLAVHRMKAVQLRLSAELLSSTEAPAPERGGAEPLSPPRREAKAPARTDARTHGAAPRAHNAFDRLFCKLGAYSLSCLDSLKLLIAASSRSEAQCAADVDAICQCLVCRYSLIRVSDYVTCEDDDMFAGRGTCQRLQSSIGQQKT